ncbi:MAG: hypothetical protein O3A01_07250 [bacterium]|nr:hypothetical protein [bacterium]
MKKLITLGVTCCLIGFSSITAHALLFRIAPGFQFYATEHIAGGTGGSFEYDAGLLNLGIGVFNHQLKNKGEISDSDASVVLTEGSLTSIPVYIKYYIPIPLPLLTPSIAVGYTFQIHESNSSKIDEIESTSGSVGGKQNISSYSERINDAPFIQAGLDYSIFPFLTIYTNVMWQSINNTVKYKALETTNESESFNLSSTTYQIGAAFNF